MTPLMINCEWHDADKSVGLNQMWDSYSCPNIFSFIVFKVREWDTQINHAVSVESATSTSLCPRIINGDYCYLYNLHQSMHSGRNQ